MFEIVPTLEKSCSRVAEVLILGAYPIGLALTEDDYDVQALGLLFCSGHDGPLVGFAPDDPDRQSLLAEWFDTAHLWGGYAPH